MRILKKYIRIDKLFNFPGKVLLFIQLYITNNIRTAMKEKDGVYLLIPKPLQMFLKGIWWMWGHYLKDPIKFLLRVSKGISSKPLMRAMSTVDHKRISVMYLMFSLFARLIRV